jgi:SSS family solute:Na+ symporter
VFLSTKIKRKCLGQQRFLTAKSLRECTRSFVLSGVYNIVWSALMGANALAILAYYEAQKVRPVQDGLIAKADQVLPYFAVTVLPRGVTGLLMAACLGSTMSVYSGGLNAAATACHLDLLTNQLQRPCEAQHTTRRLRLLTLCFAVLTIALSFAASAFTGIVVLSNLILGVCAGPLLGLFLLGMLTTRTNYEGALVGILGGVAIMLYHHRDMLMTTGLMLRFTYNLREVVSLHMMSRDRYYGFTQLECPPQSGDAKQASPLPSICTSVVFSWW